MSTRHTPPKPIGARLPRYIAAVPAGSPQEVKDFAAASETAHALWLDYLRSTDKSDMEKYRSAAEHALSLGIAAEKALRAAEGASDASAEMMQAVVKAQGAGECEKVGGARA